MRDGKINKVGSCLCKMPEEVRFSLAECSPSQLPSGSASKKTCAP